MREASFTSINVHLGQIERFRKGFALVDEERGTYSLTLYCSGTQVCFFGTEDQLQGLVKTFVGGFADLSASAARHEAEKFLTEGLTPAPSPSRVT